MANIIATNFVWAQLKMCGMVDIFTAKKFFIKLLAFKKIIFDFDYDTDYTIFDSFSIISFLTHRALKITRPLNQNCTTAYQEQKIWNLIFETNIENC